MYPKVTRTKYNDRGHDIQFVRKTSPNANYCILSNEARLKLAPVIKGIWCGKDFIMMLLNRIDWYGSKRNPISIDDTEEPNHGLARTLLLICEANSQLSQAESRQKLTNKMLSGTAQ